LWSYNLVAECFFYPWAMPQKIDTLLNEVPVVPASKAVVVTAARD